MNDTQTLELQMKATAEQCTQAIDKLISSLTSMEKVVSKTTNSGKKLNQVGTQMTNLKKHTDNATTSAGKLTKALSLSGAYMGVKRLTNQFMQWMNLSVDFTEQLNLFNVVFDNVKKDGVQTFSELGRSATQFQNQMNEAFGTNKTETLKYQALFQSMGENVGIDDSYSAIMSETMTKLTYDLASLYNKSETTVAEALRAGVYAG